MAEIFFSVGVIKLFSPIHPCARRGLALGKVGNAIRGVSVVFHLIIGLMGVVGGPGAKETHVLVVGDRRIR